MKSAVISVCDTFPRVDVEMCSDCKCDYLQRETIYSNFHRQSKLCGRNSYNYLQSHRPVKFTGDFFGSTGYLRFVSDDTVHYTGFKLTFIAMSRPGG